jgi:hypothetical protein
MSARSIGELVKVSYVDQFEYVFHVEITAINAALEFKGRIKRIFAANDGEITGGKILQLKNQERTFNETDIVN